MMKCQNCGFKYNPNKEYEPLCPKCDVWDDWNYYNSNFIQKLYYKIRYGF